MVKVRQTLEEFYAPMSSGPMNMWERRPIRWEGEPDVATIEEAADALRIKSASVRSAIRKGKLTPNADGLLKWDHVSDYALSRPSFRRSVLKAFGGYCDLANEAE